MHNTTTSHFSSDNENYIFSVAIRKAEGLAIKYDLNGDCLASWVPQCGTFDQQEVIARLQNEFPRHLKKSCPWFIERLVKALVLTSRVHDDDSDDNDDKKHGTSCRNDCHTLSAVRLDNVLAPNDRRNRI